MSLCRKIIGGCCLLCLGLVGELPAQPLQALVEEFVQRPPLQTARVSLSLIDIAANKEVAAWQPHKALAPASSLKTLTTATALLVLGENYRFKTELQTDGYLDAAGVLQGNLYLKGYGDPSLGSGREGTLNLNDLLELLCEHVTQAGIKEIAGDVLADDSWLGNAPLPEGWSEKDGGNYYAAGIWSLNIAENMYRLRFRQNPKTGGAVSILDTEPEVPGLQLRSYVTSGPPGSGDNAYIYGLPYDFNREVRGSIPPGRGVFTIKGSLPDAPLFAAQQLKARLEQEGIPVQGRAGVWRKPKPDRPRELIATLYAPPLSKLVEWINRESLNLYAEALLRALAKERTGEGSVEAARRVIAQTWEERGLMFRGLQLYDGSGLSAKNRIAAHDLAVLMRKMYVHEPLRRLFLYSLPVAGKRGTLKSYLADSPAAGRIYAKTGSMKGVRSLTGYLHLPSGKWLAFSILVNDYTGSSSAVWREMLSFLERVLMYEEQ